jgi:hypothetical protein
MQRPCRSRKSNQCNGGYRKKRRNKADTDSDSDGTTDAVVFFQIGIGIGIGIENSRALCAAIGVAAAEVVRFQQHQVVLFAGEESLQAEVRYFFCAGVYANT